MNAESVPKLLRDLMAASEFGRAQAARASRQSASRFTVLVQLADEGPVKLGHIAQRMTLTTGAVTALTDALESEGLVQRRPNPADRRSVLLSLTDAGRTLVDSYLGAFDRAVLLAVADMDQDQMEALQILVSRTITSLTRTPPVQAESAGEGENPAA